MAFDISYSRKNHENFFCMGSWAIHENWHTENKVLYGIAEIFSSKIYMLHVQYVVFATNFTCTFMMMLLLYMYIYM